MTWRRLYFSGKGRVGRKDFWIAVLLLNVLTAPLRLLGPMGALLGLLLLFPQTCLFAKRLHDRGCSGWLAAAPLGLGFVAGSISVLVEDAGPGRSALLSIAGGVCAIAGFVVYLRIALARTGDVDNRYGPPPAPFFGRGKLPSSDVSVF